MKQDDTTTDTAPVSSARGTSSVMLLSIADTTWRMFVPTIGLLMLGRFFDQKLSTKPWLMIAGVLVGGLISTLLVIRQLKALNTGRTT